MLSRYKQNVNGVLTNCLESKENKTMNKTKSIIKDNIYPENKFSEFIPLSLEFHKNKPLIYKKVKRKLKKYGL